jgi:hypothetical protein
MELAPLAILAAPSTKIILCSCAAFVLKIAAEIYWSDHGWKTNGDSTHPGLGKAPSHARI